MSFYRLEFQDSQGKKFSMIQKFKIFDSVHFKVSNFNITCSRMDSKQSF